MNGRLRRIAKIVGRLQPDGLGGKRNVFTRSRSDPLDLLQAELQQVNFASPALGLFA